MRNRFMVLALVAVLALSLSGLVAAQDQTTVRVWTGSSSPVEDKYKQDQVAAFMKANPDIKVDLQILPSYGDQIQAAFASGWHAYMDILEDRLRGVEPRAFWTNFDRLQNEYAGRFKE